MPTTSMLLLLLLLLTAAVAVPVDAATAAARVPAAPGPLCIEIGLSAALSGGLAAQGESTLLVSIIVGGGWRVGPTRDC